MSELGGLVTDYVRRVLWDQVRHQDRVLRKCILDHGRTWPWNVYLVEVIPGSDEVRLYWADQPIPDLPGVLPFERRLFQITPEAVEVVFRDVKPDTTIPTKPPQEAPTARSAPYVGDGMPERPVDALSGLCATCGHHPRQHYNRGKSCYDCRNSTCTPTITRSDPPASCATAEACKTSGWCHGTCPESQ